MKRYYICDIVYSDRLGYYPKVMDYPTNAVSAIMPDNLQAPGAWALCVVDADSHARIIADPRCDPLPDFAFDAKVSAMHGPTKTAMKAGLTRRGISAAFVDNADGYREVVRTLGRTHQPKFDENDFDAAVS